MNIERRISITLLLSLVMWYPNMRAAFGGGMSLDVAGLRLLLTVGVVWFAIAVLNRVYVHYAFTSQREALEQHLMAMEARPQRRREERIAEVDAARDSSVSEPDVTQV